MNYANAQPGVPMNPNGGYVDVPINQLPAYIEYMKRVHELKLQAEKQRAESEARAQARARAIAEAVARSRAEAARKQQEDRARAEAEIRAQVATAAAAAAAQQAARPVTRPVARPAARPVTGSVPAPSRYRRQGFGFRDVQRFASGVEDRLFNTGERGISALRGTYNAAANPIVRTELIEMGGGLSQESRAVDFVVDWVAMLWPFLALCAIVVAYCVTNDSISWSPMKRARAFTILSSRLFISYLFLLVSALLCLYGAYFFYTVGAMGGTFQMFLGSVLMLVFWHLLMCVLNLFVTALLYLYTLSQISNSAEPADSGKGDDPILEVMDMRRVRSGLRLSNVKLGEFSSNEDLVSVPLGRSPNENAAGKIGWVVENMARRSDSDFLQNGSTFYLVFFGCVFALITALNTSTGGGLSTAVSYATSYATGVPPEALSLLPNLALSGMVTFGVSRKVDLQGITEFGTLTFFNLLMTLVGVRTADAVFITVLQSSMPKAGIYRRERNEKVTRLRDFLQGHLRNKDKAPFGFCSGEVLRDFARSLVLSEIPLQERLDRASTMFAFNKSSQSFKEAVVGVLAGDVRKLQSKESVLQAALQSNGKAGTEVFEQNWDASRERLEKELFEVFSYQALDFDALRWLGVNADFLREKGRDHSSGQYPVSDLRVAFSEKFDTIMGQAVLVETECRKEDGGFLRSGGLQGACCSLEPLALDVENFVFDASTRSFRRSFANL